MSTEMNRIIFVAAAVASISFPIWIISHQMRHKQENLFGEFAIHFLKGTHIQNEKLENSFFSALIFLFPFYSLLFRELSALHSSKVDLKKAARRHKRIDKQWNNGKREMFTFKKTSNKHTNLRQYALLHMKWISFSWISSTAERTCFESGVLLFEEKSWCNEGRRTSSLSL